MTELLFLDWCLVVQAAKCIMGNLYMIRYTIYNLCSYCSLWDVLSSLDNYFFRYIVGRVHLFMACCWGFSDYCVLIFFSFILLQMLYRYNFYSFGMTALYKNQWKGSWVSRALFQRSWQYYSPNFFIVSSIFSLNQLALDSCGDLLAHVWPIGQCVLRSPGFKYLKESL